MYGTSSGVPEMEVHPASTGPHAGFGVQSGTVCRGKGERADEILENDIEVMGKTGRERRNEIAH